jgi:hypothetical protein
LGGEKNAAEQVDGSFFFPRQKFPGERRSLGEVNDLFLHEVNKLQSLWAFPETEKPETPKGVFSGFSGFFRKGSRERKNWKISAFSAFSDAQNLRGHSSRPPEIALAFTQKDNDVPSLYRAIYGVIEILAASISRLCRCVIIGPRLLAMFRVVAFPQVLL